MNKDLFFSDESARLYKDKDTNLSVIECIALAEIMRLETDQSIQGTNKNNQEKYITNRRILK